MWLASTASGRPVEMDMPIGQQRISHPIASFGLRMGLGEKNATQIVVEIGRKEGFSLEFLYLYEMPRLRGGGRSHVRTLLRPNSLLTGKNTGNIRFRAVSLRDKSRGTSALAKKSGSQERIGTGNDQGANRDWKFPETLFSQ